MNKIELKIEFTNGKIFEFSEDEKALFQNAKLACELSHAPYSKFKVGCAILLDNGMIIKGANQENAAYPVCLCAEGVTLASVASQYPNQRIEAVAIYVPLQNPALPCGYCRQSFKEYEMRMNKKFKYYLVGEEDVYSFIGIDTLLPLSFSGEDLFGIL